MDKRKKMSYLDRLIIEDGLADTHNITSVSEIARRLQKKPQSLYYEIKQTLLYGADDYNAETSVRRARKENSDRLSYLERLIIEDMISHKKKDADVAKKLNRSRAAIFYELLNQSEYCADEKQRYAC